MTKTFLKKLFRRASEHSVRLPPGHPAVVLPDPTTGLFISEDLAVEPRPNLFTVLSLHNHQILVRYLQGLPLPPVDTIDDPSAYFYITPKPKAFEIEPGRQFTLIVGDKLYIVEIASVLTYPPTGPTLYEGTGDVSGNHDSTLPARPSGHEERQPELRHPHHSTRRVSRRGLVSTITRLDTPSPPVMPPFVLPPSPNPLSDSEMDEYGHAGPSNSVHPSYCDREDPSHGQAYYTDNHYMAIPQPSPRPRDAHVAPVPPVPQTPPPWAVMHPETPSSHLYAVQFPPAHPVLGSRHTKDPKMKDLPPTPDMNLEAERRSLNTPAFSPNYLSPIKETPTSPRKRPRQEVHRAGTAVPSTRTPLDLDEASRPLSSQVKRRVKFLLDAGSEENHTNDEPPSRPPVLQKLAPVSLPSANAPYPAVVPRPPSPPKLYQPQAKRPAVELLGSKAGVLPTRIPLGLNNPNTPTGAGSAALRTAPIPENALGLQADTGPERQAYLGPPSVGRRRASTSQFRTIGFLMGHKGMPVLGAELREEVREEYWDTSEDLRTRYPIPHGKENRGPADTVGYGYATLDMRGYAPERKEPKILDIDARPPNAAILSGDAVMFEMTKAAAIFCWTNSLQPGKNTDERAL